MLRASSQEYYQRIIPVPKLKFWDRFKILLSADFFSSQQVADTILKVFEREYSKGDIASELFQETFSKLSSAIDEGYGKGNIEYGHPDFEFKNELKHNAAVFSAFKNHEQTALIVDQLLDKDGKQRSFADFRKAALQVSKNYNERYLRSEYNTAVRAARSAEQWKRFEETADIYPNLEYLPSTSVEQRDEHRVYYGMIRPITDPIWDRIMPPNGWGCNCSVQRTSKEPNGGSVEPLPPTPGIDGNPGKTGQVFSKTHSYVKNTTKAGKKNVQRQAEKLEKHAIRKIVQDYARENVVGKPLKHKEFDSSISVSSKSLKEILNQNHKHYNDKNYLVYNLQSVLDKAKYVTSAPDHKNNPMIKAYHYFEFELKKEKSYLVVREQKDGRLLLWSIVDNLR